MVDDEANEDPIGRRFAHHLDDTANSSPAVKAGAAAAAGARQFDIVVLSCWPGIIRSRRRWLVVKVGAVHV